jgi:hypothetical protein
MTTPTLAERIVAIHAALDEVPHAFGGAIALAYYAEPRATIDIDLNVFVPVERFTEVATPLAGLGVSVDEPDIGERVHSDGQVRVWWDDTPIDLFFAYDAFHDVAASAVVDVPFADTRIPILKAEHLVVCKAVFDRARDWVDLDAMVADGTAIDPAEVLRWVGRIAGDTDPRYERVAALLMRI